MRAKHEGNIYHRKDGLWQASLQVQGKRRYVYGKSRGEVAKKLEGLKREAAPTSTHLLQELCDEWLEAKEVKATTRADYRACIRLYMMPLMALRVDQITPEVIERHYSTLRQQGRNRAALKVHMLLGQMLSLGLRWGWIGRNPLDVVPAPKYTPKPKSVWTLDELQQFLKGTVDTYLHPLYMLLFASGIRLGEALALTWEDVREDHIVIGKTAQRVDGERIVSRPKTLAGSRKVAVPPAVLSLLERRNPVWVFVGERLGKPLEASTVQGRMRRDCFALGLRWMSPHGFRHLHASVLLQEGLSVPQVSRRLGHADAYVTMKVYAHLLDSGEEDAVEAIGKVIGE